MSRNQLVMEAPELFAWVFFHSKAIGGKSMVRPIYSWFCCCFSLSNEFKVRAHGRASQGLAPCCFFECGDLFQWCCSNAFGVLVASEWVGFP